jgi:hypothetical protein
MRFTDINRQTTWVKQCQVFVDEVGQPMESKHGWCQAIIARDSVGLQECINYFFNHLTFEVKLDEVGPRWYNIRWLRDKGYYQGVPCEAPSAVKLDEEGPDWDKIALGKCRYGILVACIQSGTSIYELDYDQINRLATFSMTGEPAFTKTEIQEINEHERK